VVCFRSMNNRASVRKDATAMKCQFEERKEIVALCLMLLEGGCTLCTAPVRVFVSPRWIDSHV
jgi:hypothetical protein